MYAEVRSAVEKVNEGWSKKLRMFMFRVVPPPDPMQASADAMVYHCQLLMDLVVYLGCRAKLVELRLTLHKKAFDAGNATSLKQGLVILTSISVHLPVLKHQLLVQLCRNMSVEVSLYQKLLQTELAIMNYQEGEAIFHFYALDLELQSCRSKSTFLKGKSETSAFLDTALYHWYQSYREHLHEKMTLLFAEYRSLRVEPQNNEPFAQEAGAELLLHEKIVEFVAQSGCFNVSLILRPADGMGSGKSSWVPIYTFPQQEAPFTHWPSIISLYQDNMEELDAPIKVSGTQLPSPLSGSNTPSPVLVVHRHHSSPSAIVAIPAQSPSGSNLAYMDPQSIPLFILHYYDTHVDTTYYMATLQPKMLLVIIFKGERQQGDADVHVFIKGLYAKLRHSQLLQKVLSRATGSSSPAPSTATPPTAATTSSLSSSSSASSIGDSTQLGGPQRASSSSSSTSKASNESPSATTSS